MHGETPVAGPHNTSDLLKLSLNRIFEPAELSISKSCDGDEVPTPILFATYRFAVEPAPIATGQL